MRTSRASEWHPHSWGGRGCPSPRGLAARGARRGLQGREAFRGINARTNGNAILFHDQQTAVAEEACSMQQLRHSGNGGNGPVPAGLLGRRASSATEWPAQAADQAETASGCAMPHAVPTRCSLANTPPAGGPSAGTASSTAAGVAQRSRHSAHAASWPSCPSGPPLLGCPSRCTSNSGPAPGRGSRAATISACSAQQLSGGGAQPQQSATGGSGWWWCT